MSDNVFTGRPSRDRQINRALALLDRLIALIEQEPDAAIPAASAVPGAVSETIMSRSPYWRDREVRAAILALYGRASIEDATSILAAEFGAERAPGKSVVARLFASIAKAKTSHSD